MVDDLGIPIAAAVATTAALDYGGRKAGLGRKRTIAGALVGGLLVGLVVGDFTIDGAGDWWASHPTVSATVTGLLLLAVTVLVIEAVVERALRAAEEERWRGIGEATATALITTIAQSVAAFRSRVLWPISVAIDQNQGEGVPHDLAGDARYFADGVQSAVLAAAPVLTATERLHDLYAGAVKALEASRTFAVDVKEWENDHGDDVGLPIAASESARIAWWGVVVGPWDHLLTVIAEFHDRAHAQLAVDPLDEDPWSTDSGPADYSEARREFLREYGPAPGSGRRRPPSPKCPDPAGPVLRALHQSDRPRVRAPTVHVAPARREPHRPRAPRRPDERDVIRRDRQPIDPRDPVVHHRRRRNRARRRATEGRPHLDHSAISRTPEVKDRGDHIRSVRPSADGDSGPRRRNQRGEGVGLREVADTERRRTVQRQLATRTARITALLRFG